MSDEPKVIAETRWHRVTARGELQESYTGSCPRWGDPCTETFRADDISALLADAARRVREEMVYELDKLWASVNGINEREQSCADKIGELENRLGIRGGRTDHEIRTLAERIEGLETDMNGIDSNCPAIADRVAALEEENRDLRSRVTENWDALTRENIALRNRLSALESRQQDEAGEGAGPYIRDRMERAEAEINRLDATTDRESAYLDRKSVV